MDKIRNQAVENLMQVMAKMSSADDCYAFFTDLCTIKELQEMAQRLEIAELLSRENHQAQKDIAADMGTSTATISRVNRCLQYGNGGYEKALKLLKEGTENGN